MENASKALIMAGEILLGVMLLTLFVYVFANFSSFNIAYDDTRETTDIAQFNAKFGVYEGKEVLAQELVSLRNLVQENNEEVTINGGNENNRAYIQIRITGGGIPAKYTKVEKLNDTGDVFEFIKYCNENKITFECKNIEKNSVDSNGKNIYDGRIHKITFQVK